LLENRSEKSVNTPYGEPSDVLVCGQISSVPCVLLARHGRRHQFNPTNVNYRANICALKSEGCTHVLATSACGGLQEHTHPGDIVLVDQFIDQTRHRIETFYDGQPGHPDGVFHIPMAEPFCEHTRAIVNSVCKGLGMHIHPKGTVLTIEGPRFSSRAESRLWHAWGCDVINMSTVPEVVLAKEAGLCYALIAMVTDYDSWREDQEHVSVEKVLKTFKENAHKAELIIREVIPKLAQKDWTEILRQKEVETNESHYGDSDSRQPLLNFQSRDSRTN
ncbi:hypothetical protein BOX15_Mlig016180g3, partial [Macrostomum lignano]